MIDDNKMGEKVEEVVSKVEKMTIPQQQQIPPQHQKIQTPLTSTNANSSHKRKFILEDKQVKKSR